MTLAVSRHPFESAERCYWSGNAGVPGNFRENESPSCQVLFLPVFSLVYFHNLCLKKIVKIHPSIAHASCLSTLDLF